MPCIQPRRLDVRILACRCVAVLALSCWGSAAATAETSNLRRSPIVKAVEEVRPSVVNIHGRKTVRSEEVQPGGGDGLKQVNGMGTGIVIDERGYILTNHHVVDGVSRIQVTTWDERTFVARAIASDFKTDLAIIKIDTPEPLPVIRIGTSSDLMPGETVIAVGNAFGYEHTVTSGIVSALHRNVQVSDEQTYRDVIQTNADINPGNSGGPLLNIDGYLVGVNVAVRVGAQGIAFTIPVDTAMEVAAQLMNAEKLQKVTHGIQVKTMVRADDLHFELVVQSVRPESAAAAAGIQPGDVITGADERPIARSLDLERALIGHKAGETLPITVRRQDETVQLSMQLEGVTRRGGSELDRAWDVLGMRLEPIAAESVQRINSRYNGGLRVLDVRENGPAAQQGIRRGDILVGMHKWETVSMANVQFILGSPEFARVQPVKFYLLRGSETLYGHLRVTSSTLR